MRVFIYEYITGGGLCAAPYDSQQLSPLAAEGKAMAAAVTADFALAGAEVVTTRDSRLAPFHASGIHVETIEDAKSEREAFFRSAASADWMLLIAPETSGVLLERCEWVEAAGGKLLSPGSEIIRLTTNKHSTAEHLFRFGIRAPSGSIFAPGHILIDVSFPAVLKPMDGCGSQGLRRIESLEQLRSIFTGGPFRCEPLIPGVAASVAVLCGPKDIIPLPPCEQHLSDDGRFTYSGGRTPLSPELAKRASQLALAAVQTLPAPMGYIGVDLILGDCPGGSGDYVIEINPRLTTSYVGLRAACRENIAQAMLALAAGNPAALSFRSEVVQFSAEGQILASRGDPSRLNHEMARA